MSEQEKKFDLYLTVLRFVAYKVTNNLRRIYLDFDFNKKRMILTSVYEVAPTEYELDLFDDIVTNSNAHIPDFFIDKISKLAKNIRRDEKHEFVIFATHDQI